MKKGERERDGEQFSLVFLNEKDKRVERGNGKKVISSPSPEEYRISGDGHEFIVQNKSLVANQLQENDECEEFFPFFSSSFFKAYSVP